MVKNASHENARITLLFLFSFQQNVISKDKFLNCLFIVISIIELLTLDKWIEFK